MKKLLLLLALAGTCAAFAQKLVPDPCNLRFLKQYNAPANWYIQTSNAENGNITYKELGGNKRIIKLAPKKDQILFYYGTAQKVVKGDVITLTIKAKGKGPFVIGYMSYLTKGRNNFAKYETIQLTDKEQTFTKTFEVTDNPKTGAKTDVIRISMAARAGAQVEVSSFNASMEE